ncbi:hypothetical protein KCU41_004394 [Vibrio vulnificus]|nr:hypothetical protein [Vibrio vulnificus]EHU4998559.1 hypothetical protein [Vibrio vulnificus]
MDIVSISGIEERVKGQTPDVLSLNYDLSVLRIKLNFPSDKIVYVACENVEGFRVLDEGQLLEFWGGDATQYWLFEVKANGWLASENKRETAPLIVEGGELKEYMVAGANECVSILAYTQPYVQN